MAKRWVLVFQAMSIVFIEDLHKVPVALCNSIQTNKQTKAMKAIQVHKYIQESSEFQKMSEDQSNEYLSMQETVAKPTIAKKNQMLVQVYACSVAPGDQMVTIQGQLVIMQQKFPFVPGMDICGKVIDHNGSTEFKKGDFIVVSNEASAIGGLAEFMVVNQEECNIKPSNVSILHAASCLQCGHG